MTFTPGYGETPITDEEAEALLPSVREALGEPIRKADVYDLEQAIAEEVAEERATAVISDAVGLEELLTEHLIRDLHTRLYGDIWQWAGRFRSRGFPSPTLPLSCAWPSTRSFTGGSTRRTGPRGSSASPRMLRRFGSTHSPMGTGARRAFSFLAAQTGEVPEQYDWEIDKAQYIALLREFDLNRDAKPLAAFIPVRPLGG